MRNLTEANLSEAVIGAMAGAQSERFREIMTVLVKHLHAFIQDVNLTEAEWLAGIQFLTDWSEARQLGIHSALRHVRRNNDEDYLKNRKPGVTEYTI
jgi:hypothetical protein